MQSTWLNRERARFFESLDIILEAANSPFPELSHVYRTFLASARSVANEGEDPDMELNKLALLHLTGNA